MPPDFKIVRREMHGLVMCDAENGEVRDLREPAADVNRVRQGRVVVAGQDHDRHAGIGQQAPGAVEQRHTKLVALKGVAGEQNNVRPQCPRGFQHRPQPAGLAALAGRGNAPLVDMNVGAVDDHHLRAENRLRLLGRAIHCRFIAVGPTAEQYGGSPSAPIARTGRLSGLGKLSRRGNDTARRPGGCGHRTRAIGGAG